MSLGRQRPAAARGCGLSGLALAVLLSAAPSAAIPAGRGVDLQDTSQDLQAMNQRVQEIDLEVRKAEREIRELDLKVKKLDRDIQADDEIIRKLENIISRARQSNNAQAETVARDNLRGPLEAKRMNERSRAALAAERKNLMAALDAARHRELAWKGEIRNLIAERLAGKPDPLTVAISESLSGPSKRLRPILKPFSDLQPGDVLLVAPEKAWNLVRFGDRLSSWEWGSRASHTFIYLRTENGKKIFLDNMPDEGPRIKDENQILREYGALSLDVAQPLSKPDGEELWNAAMKLAKANLAKTSQGGRIDETGFGLYGDDNMVCSEASRWALIQAGVPVPDTESPFKKALGIYFGPSNFYSQKQHFLIAAVDMPKSTANDR